MKYKVGDEVLVKAKLAGCTSSARIMLEVDRTKLFVNEEDIITVQEMNAEEAWEIAKKLFADYSNAELDEIFGKGWSFPKLMELTPQEAKAKIEEWEAENEIKVGDEVEHKEYPSRDSFKFFVTKLDKKENVITGFSGFDGGVFCRRDITKYQKTGRHVNIDGLLKQIGGDE